MVPFKDQANKSKVMSGNIHLCFLSSIYSKDTEKNEFTLSFCKLIFSLS